MADRRRLAFWAAAVLLVGVTLLAYLPALGGGFVWDDDSFLTGNKFVKAADGRYRFWFTTDPTDYWPVTSSVLWFEWRLWGMNPLGYHAVNLGLHLAEVFLLRAVLRRLRFPAPYLAAFLFAVHPVEVESVACNVTWTVPFVQPLGSVAAVVTGGLLSMLMWPVWKSSALPAASET